PINLPEGAHFPFERFAHCLQQIAGAISKVSRLRKHTGHGILHCQSLLSALIFSDVACEAASVDQFFFLPQTTGTDLNKLDRTIFGSHPSIAVAQHLSGLQSLKKVTNNRCVDVKLTELVAHIFIAAVTKKVQLCLVYAEHSAVR